MRSLLILSLITVSCAFASPARAETKPASGPMQYTRIREAPPEKDESSQQIKLKTVQRGDEVKKEDETPSNRIWNKYKALASGQPELTVEERARQEAEEKEIAGEFAEFKKEKALREQIEKEKILKEELEKEKSRPTGIAAIIDEYRRNKAQRSQMRTITVTKPGDTTPAPANAKEKPES